MDEKKLVEEIVSSAQRQGVEVEAYVRVGRETQIQVDQGKVEKLSHATNKGLGVRILRDGREGYAYTSDFSPESVTRTWKSALELANVVDEDEFRKLPVLEKVPEDDLEIHDPVIAATSIEEKIKFALDVERAALGFDKRVVLTNRCSYIDHDYQVYLANSNGFSAGYDHSVAVSFLIAIGRDEDDTATGLGFGVSTFASDLNSEAIGREAGSNAVRLLAGKPVPTQQGTVVFSPQVAAQLIAFLAQALTADAMQKGRTFLLDKMGETIASDNVSVVDNGLLPRGLGTAPFDGEGVPRRATRLIDEGILQAVLHDSYTARKDGVSSTGNAARASHRQPAVLAPSNFYLQPGNLAAEDIIANVDKGLYVLNTMSVGGINPTSGDYSAAARGIWIENGELKTPVNEVTIAAPMSKMLKNISAVGEDLRILPTMGAIGSPTIRIDGMMIGGK